MSKKSSKQSIQDEKKFDTKKQLVYDNSDLIVHLNNLENFLQYEEHTDCEYEIDSFPRRDKDHTELFLNNCRAKVTAHQNYWLYREAILKNGKIVWVEYDPMPNKKYDYIVYFGCGNPHILFAFNDWLGHGTDANFYDSFLENIIFTNNKLENNGKIIFIEPSTSPLNKCLLRSTHTQHNLYTLEQLEFFCSRLTKTVLDIIFKQY